MRELLEFLGSALSSVRQHVLLRKVSHIFFKIEIRALVSVCLWRSNLSTQIYNAFKVVVLLGQQTRPIILSVGKVPSRTW